MPYDVNVILLTSLILLVSSFAEFCCNFIRGNKMASLNLQNLSKCGKKCVSVLSSYKGFITKTSFLTRLEDENYLHETHEIMWLKIKTSTENESAVVSPRVSVLPDQCFFTRDSAPQCWENTRLRKVRFEGCEDRSWLTSWLFPSKALLCVQQALLKDVKGIGKEGCGDCNMQSEHLAAVKVESPQPLSAGWVCSAFPHSQTTCFCRTCNYWSVNWAVSKENKLTGIYVFSLPSSLVKKPFTSERKEMKP